MHHLFTSTNWAGTYGRALPTESTYSAGTVQELRADRAAPALRALRDLDLRAESIAEVDAQHLFRVNGIAFEAQVHIPGIGRVDFLLDGFLIVEIDGYAFHSKLADMLRDRDRNNSSTVKGYAVLRYTPERIWFNQEQVLSEIRAALAHRTAGQGGASGWRPAPGPTEPQRACRWG